MPQRPDDSGAGGDTDPLAPDLSAIPYETESADEARRREASAQFHVESEVGSDAVLREAMDPANQSLADALRLSFRVLQFVILVLIVLFIFSGVQTVEEDESGVLTRWGNIVSVGGSKALEPGLHYSWLPYPAGEFILFKDRNRLSDAGNAFWPDLRGQSREAALERASVTDPMLPGRDGYVLTRDGDLAHLRLSARYTIEDPVLYVQQLKLHEADAIVTLAMRRAIVQAAAVRSLQELIDLTDDDKSEIQSRVQQMLDDLNCGIRLGILTLPENPSAPFAIEGFRVAVQEARVSAERKVVQARQRADEILNRAAGKDYREIIRMIETYEDALELGEEERAEEILGTINTRLGSDQTAGAVATIIGDARSYESQVEVTLGSEARRFNSQLAAFREHPDLIVMQRWLDAFTTVLDQPDIEAFFLPNGVSFNLNITGSNEVAELRRKMRLDRKQQRSIREGLEALGITGRYILRGEDYEIGRAGRQLRVTEQGGTTGIHGRGR